jgi:SRSO17 transposase
LVQETAKGVQPMAMRAGEIGYDQLHHFVTAGVWDSGPLEAALLKKADGLVGDDAGFLVIDDTTLPKKGYHSVGVAPQYASSLGKTANCQLCFGVEKGLLRTFGAAGACTRVANLGER